MDFDFPDNITFQVLSKCSTFQTVFLTVDFKVEVSFLKSDWGIGMSKIIPKSSLSSLDGPLSMNY